MNWFSRILCSLCFLTLTACSSTTPVGLAPLDDVSVHDRCYRNSRDTGEAPDFAEARVWCKVGAERGIPSSQVLYAQLFMNGDGVPKDLATALEWYGKAAQREHQHALLMLYRMHALGEATSKDAAKAVGFLKRSAGAGNKTAIEELERIDRMPENEKRRADAVKGDASAQVAMALYHSWGPLLVRDYPQAVDWFEKAAAGGSALAKNNLADLYEKGEGVPRDFPKAISLYREAAATGLAVSLYSLAEMYESGQGMEKSKAMAYLYFRMASRENSKGYFEEKAVQNGHRLALALPAAEVATLNQIADAWKPGAPLPTFVSSK